MTIRSRIVWDPEVDSTPFDRDGHLTEWRLVGGTNFPAPVTGPVGPARAFDGTAGYEAADASSVHTGLRALTVRVIIKPRLEDMAGTTVVLASRGRGGPTAGEYWSWQVRLDVAPAGDSAVVSLVWQDSAGVLEMANLATIIAPPGDGWTFLSITRETPTDISLCRMVQDGESAGPEIGSAATSTATPGETVTLGCRRNGASYDQFYVGEMDLVEIRDQAVTDLQERHWFLEQRILPGLSLDAARAYWFQGGFSLHDSDYERYRLRPLARQQAALEAALLRRAEAGLPDAAYDARLVSWERALALPEALALSVAERQARARALIALVDGLSDAAMQAMAAAVLGVDSTEVTIQYCANDIDYNLEEHLVVYASELGARSQVEGARVSGNMEATWTGSALQIKPQDLGVSTLYQGYAVEAGAGLTEWAVDPNKRASLHARVRFDLSFPTLSTHWIGLTMRVGNDVCFLAPVGDLASLLFIQANASGVHTTTNLGPLPASASVTWDLVLMYEDVVRESSTAPLRVRLRAAEEGIDDWQDFMVAAALPDSPGWMGIGLASSGSTSDVRAHIELLRLQRRDHATSFRWTAVVPTLSTDPVTAALSLQRKNRASAVAAYSKDAVFTADSPGSFADYTPTLCGD
jgi:hypothetical protein